MCRLIFAGPRSAADVMFLYTLVEISGLDNQVDGWGVSSADFIYRNTVAVNKDIETYQHIMKLPLHRVVSIHIRQTSNVLFSRGLDAIHPFQVGPDMYLVHNGVFTDYRAIGKQYGVSTDISDTHTMSAILKIILQKPDMTIPKALQEWVNTFSAEPKYAIGVHAVKDNTVYIFRNKTRPLTWSVIDDDFIVVHTLEQNIKAVANIYGRKITKMGEVEVNTLYALSNLGLQEVCKINTPQVKPSVVYNTTAHTPVEHTHDAVERHKYTPLGEYENYVRRKLVEGGFMSIAAGEIAAHLKDIRSTTGRPHAVSLLTDINKQKVNLFYQLLSKKSAEQLNESIPHQQRYANLQVGIVKKAFYECFNRAVAVASTGVVTLQVEDIMDEMLRILKEF